MELVLGDVFQRHEFVDTGIVHQHVDRAEGFFGFVKQPLHVGGLGDVALDGNGLTAVRFDVGDNTVRALLAGGIFTTTAAPAALKPLAMAAPIPFDAPVTTATLPFKSLMELLLAAAQYRDEKF
jgi:hypothetical protein